MLSINNVVSMWHIDLISHNISSIQLAYMSYVSVTITLRNPTSKQPSNEHCQIAGQV